MNFVGGRTGSPWSTAHRAPPCMPAQAPPASRRDRWGLGQRTPADPNFASRRAAAGPPLPPLLPRHMRRGSAVAPGWRRDGRRVLTARGARCGGSLPGTESHDIGPALAPMPRPVRGLLFRFGAFTAARRSRCLLRLSPLLDRLALAVVGCTSPDGQCTSNLFEWRTGLRLRGICATVQVRCAPAPVAHVRNTNRATAALPQAAAAASAARETSQGSRRGPEHR